MMAGSRIHHKLAAIVVAILFAVPILLGGFAVLQESRDLQTEWTDQIEQFDKIRSIANFDVTKMASEKNGAAIDTLVLGHEPTAILVAKLQAQLREVATQHGVDILQASDLTPIAIHEGLQKIGTRLEIVGPYQGMIELFRQIDQVTPLLLVENVELHSSFAEGNALQAEPPLSATIDVWGLAPVGQKEKQP
jgi:Type II secretion system (T2SS), protein M subtype b